MDNLQAELDLMKDLPRLAEFLNEEANLLEDLCDEIKKTGDWDKLILSLTDKTYLERNFFSMNFSPFSHMVRRKYIRRYGFPLWSNEATEKVLSISTKLLSVGAGTGFLERTLQVKGADIIATDINPEKWVWSHFDRIEELQGVEAVEKYPERDLFISWPSYDETWAHEVIQALQPGRVVFYVGEGRGGCTADDDFHSYLDENCEEVDVVHLPSWWGIHDNLYIYRKNR